MTQRGLRKVRLLFYAERIILCCDLIVGYGFACSPIRRTLKKLCSSFLCQFFLFLLLEMPGLDLLEGFDGLGVTELLMDHGGILI